MARTLLNRTVIIPEGTMIGLFKKLWKDESALSAVEYGIVACVLGIGLTTVLVGFRDKVVALFDATGESIEVGKLTGK